MWGVASLSHMSHLLQRLTVPFLFCLSTAATAMTGGSVVAPPVWMSETYAPGISPEDEDPVLQARAFAEDFRISMGGQIVSSINTSVRVDGPNRGTELSLEDEPGFQSEVSVFRVDAAWRMTGHHDLIASYDDLSLLSSKVICHEAVHGQGSDGEDVGAVLSVGSAPVYQAQMCLTAAIARGTQEPSRGLEARATEATVHTHGIGPEQPPS